MVSRSAGLANRKKTISERNAVSSIFPKNRGQWFWRTQRDPTPHPTAQEQIAVIFGVIQLSERSCLIAHCLTAFLRFRLLSDLGHLKTGKRYFFSREMVYNEYISQVYPFDIIPLLEWRKW